LVTSLKTGHKRNREWLTAVCEIQDRAASSLCICKKAVNDHHLSCTLLLQCKGRLSLLPFLLASRLSLGLNGNGGLAVVDDSGLSLVLVSARGSRLCAKVTVVLGESCYS